MTNRLDALFERFREEGRSALIAYLMAGYPAGVDTSETIRGIAAAGADIIEVGIPFSDPLADGATIQMASEAALKGGTTAGTAIEAVAGARAAGVETPVVFMTYFNIVMRFGLERFAAEAAAAGADGVILPDLPPEEAAGWLEAAGRAGLAPVFLVAPTSSPDRIKMITEVSEGFVYCVSLAGVTGGRAELPAGLPDFIQSVRASTEKPVAVGFGVSTPEQASELSRLADGVIVGSALIDKMKEGGAAGVAAAAGFVNELKAGMR